MLKTRPINSVFQLNKQKYKVIQGIGCTECAFYKKPDCNNKLLGLCSSGARADSTETIFKLC